MRIDIEDVLVNVSQRMIWNQQSLSDLEFYKDGNKVTIPEEEIEEFIFTGLNNVDFVVTRKWK